MRRVEAVNPRVSYADLQRMPDDGNRYELYDGELWMVPSPMPRHQRVARRLFLTVQELAEREGGEVFFAPFDIVFSEYSVVQPDIIFFGPASAARIRPDEHVHFPPDLAIEVLSPSTARNDRGRKRDLMARHAVPEYWVVDPERRAIEVSSLRGGRYGEPRIVRSGRCTSDTLAGLEVDLDVLFQGLDDDESAG